jgi:hypothetical protein
MGKIVIEIVGGSCGPKETLGSNLRIIMEGIMLLRGSAAAQMF